MGRREVPAYCKGPKSPVLLGGEGAGNANVFAIPKAAVNQIRTPFDSGLILPAVPAAPFRGIVVIDLPWEACAVKFAAVLPHPYVAKGD
jgi:hypothetical protein